MLKGKAGAIILATVAAVVETGADPYNAKQRGHFKSSVVLLRDLFYREAKSKLVSDFETQANHCYFLFAADF